MSKPTLFGSFNGADVLEVTLRSDAGAEARIISYGGVVRDLIVPSKAGPQHVVLGFEKFEDYPAYSPHFGANPGRVANRIGFGRFTLDGVTYDLSKSHGGPHTLHGGATGFGKRVWSLVQSDQRSASFVLVSEDGDMGFPGRVVTTVTYRLLEPATLQVIFTAITDKATPVNLAQHSYFNLDGSPDVLDQHMQIDADFYTPTDADLIPTGEILSVAGTPWDFRSDRTLRFDTLDGSFKYDGNLVLRGSGVLARAARAWSPKSGVSMETWTTQPGVQLYDAAKLNIPVPGLGGAKYGTYGGFCLETQNFPDAVNKGHFPSSILRPGEVYHHETQYRFAQV
jgi:aldose 1-epimerase